MVTYPHMTASSASHPVNVEVTVAGGFTAEPMNDSGVGADGKMYVMTSPDATVTLPALSSMDPDNGIKRCRFKTDWESRRNKAHAPGTGFWTTVGTDALSAPNGFPNKGEQWVDIIATATGWYVDN